MRESFNDFLTGEAENKSTEMDHHLMQVII